LLAAVLVSLVATLLVHSTPAHASSGLFSASGRVCMFKAPSGAFGAGHVGWAFRVDSDAWYFGATEDTGGKPNVPPGGDTGSWSAFGSFDRVTAEFRNHGANYYRQYRCRDWAGSDARRARSAIDVQAHNGYNLLANNCLDKSIAIFRAFGINDLPDGHAWRPVPIPFPPFVRMVPVPRPPNYYFDHMLPGFEGAQNL